MSTTTERLTTAETFVPGHGAPASAPLLSFVGIQVLRDLRRLLTVAVLGAAAAVGIALAIPNEYTAEASFIPDAENTLPEGIGSLVGQFAGLQTGALSPRLAGDLVTNTPSLTRTAYERFPTRSSGGRADSVRLLDAVTRPNLLTRLIAPHPDSAHRELQALRELRNRVAADVNERTGVVTVVATFRDPVLAAAVANRLVDRVDEFNAHTTQTRARATRRFLEGRTNASAAELARAETALQQFYATNRTFQSSPRLTLEEERLKREVEIQQQVYLSLVQKLESARIDEVKDTPVLTRVEQATPPPKKSFPKVSLFALSGAVLGALLALGRSVARACSEWYRNEDPAGFAALAAAADPARAVLRRAFHPSSWRRSAGRP